MAGAVFPNEARQFFLALVNDTLQEKFDRLCQKAVSPARCQNELRVMAGLASVEAPRMRSIHPAAFAVAPRGKRASGQVIAVEGRDRRGRPYATEVFVFRDKGRLVAKNILWRSGMSDSTEHPATTAPKPTSAHAPYRP